MGDPKHTRWGTYGDFIFQLLTSPVYGSYTESKSARYTEHRRIITRNDDGSLNGQKPFRELAGLDLVTISFSCRISSVVLSTISTSLWGKLAMDYGPGPLGPGLFGNEDKDTRFYTDIPSFLETLDQYLESQEPHELIIGSEPKGMYTLDSINKKTLHKPDGSDKIVDIDLSFTEWISE